MAHFMLRSSESQMRVVAHAAVAAAPRAVKRIITSGPQIIATARSRVEDGVAG